MRQVPYHKLGVNLEGIAWLEEHHGDELLKVIKERRVREFFKMGPEDPVSAEQLQKHESALDLLTNDDVIGYDWLFVIIYRYSASASRASTSYF